MSNIVARTFWLVAKRYEVNKCAAHGVYWGYLKLKDCKLIVASLYTYLCTAICISADGCILWKA